MYSTIECTHCKKMLVQSEARMQANAPEIDWPIEVHITCPVCHNLVKFHIANKLRVEGIDLD
jgi:phage FluMu protein Com